KSRLTPSLAPPTVGRHQEPFQLTGVEVQLLRGPIHALSASNVNGQRPQLLRDRRFPCARLSPLLKSRPSAVDSIRFFDVCCHRPPCRDSNSRAGPISRILTGSLRWMRALTPQRRPVGDSCSLAVAER